MSLHEALKRARVYDLSHPLVPGMPHSPNHVPFTMALTRRHGDHVREDGSSGSSELIMMSGHSGTHIDGLAHISHAGKLYGEIDATEATREGRFDALGMETVAPIIARAILLDVAAARGEDCLPPSDAVTGDELEQAANLAGVTIGEGDALLIHTGWGRTHWDDAVSFVGFESGVPGVNVSGAEWLIAHRPLLAGSDTMAFEWLAPRAGHSRLPVHRMLIPEQGIHIMEMLNLAELADDKVYESTLVVAPLPLVGATGSPVRPLAFFA